MGGGIISLVANGAQDVYLTANPQITYFKVIYRRYTNFAMETIEHSIDSVRPGGSYSVQVQRNGDLATKTALRLKVPAITSDVLGSCTEKVAWVRRIGHALIKEIEVKIGGMYIDKHIGTWLDIYWELTHTQSSERGYRALIGDVEELTELKKACGLFGDTPDPEEIMDAIGDLLYVVLGTAAFFGMLNAPHGGVSILEEVFDKIHEANMKKIPVKSADESKRNTPYDALKPEGWEKPDLSEFSRGFFGYCKDCCCELTEPDVLKCPACDM